MAEQEYTPTEAEIWARASAGAVASLRLTDQRSQAEATRGIERIKAEVRADERAKLQDRIEELEKNLSYEVEQKIKLADTLRDERAKRPDREQLARIQFEIDNVHQIHGETCLCGFKSSRSRSRTEHLTALFADAVLALEPEARAEPRKLDDGEQIDFAMDQHQPVISFRDGSIAGCQCMDRVFYVKTESWGQHLAEVALAALSEAREEPTAKVEAEARCPYCSKVVEVHREGWFYDHGNPEPCPGSGDRPEAPREVSGG